MKQNMGNMDRVIRILVSIAITILYLTGFISGTLATILLIVAGVFVLTSFISFCPLYYLLRISSRKKQNTTRANKNAV